jgi:2-polyprenyl-6-methoxyphenol hydroxylase-like FAD-dependent oxidoreductase
MTATTLTRHATYPPSAAPPPSPSPAIAMPSYDAAAAGALPPPRPFGWPLKTLDSARTSYEVLPDGRAVLAIAHDVVKGCTPRMIHWWFTHIDGVMPYDGAVHHRYLVWHPLDHAHWSFDPAPDGTAGVGARFHIVEALGRDPRRRLAVHDRVEQSDESGFLIVQRRFGLKLAELRHRFTPVPCGTQYDSRLTLGTTLPVVGRPLNALLRRFVLPEATGRAWLKHNVEEVGNFERFLPALYEAETGKGNGADEALASRFAPTTPAAGPAPLTGLRAVVVGAAMGGATAALLLAGAGAHVTLLERVKEPKPVGGGILLQPNGIAVLRGLGLGDAITRHGYATRELRIVDARGRRIVSSPNPNYGHGLDHVACIRRSYLFTALLDAARAHPRIDLRLGAEVIGATPEGAVAYAEDGNLDATQVLHADLVVAADGVHSGLRDAGNFGARVTRTGVSYVRALVPVQPVQPDASEFVEAWTPLGIFGAGPVDGGTYLYASAGAPEVAAALRARDLDAFRAAWGRAYPAAAPLLAAVERFEQLVVNEVIRVDNERWSDGRITLLGDAAHAMFPNLGQGANSAMVDAAVLVHELCAALGPHGGTGAPGSGPRALDVPAALARYEARRHPAVRAVQDTAQRLAGLGHQPNGAVRWLRDTTLRALTSVMGGERELRRAQQEEPAWLLETAGRLARLADVAARPA